MMASGTRQTSMNRSFLGTPRGQRITFARATRSSVRERNFFPFRRRLTAGIRHANVGSVFDDTEVNCSDAHNDIARQRQRKDFVVGIDYGTTFTSVSYYAFENVGLKRLAKASDVKTIKNWPDAPHYGDEQVPSETWYSPVPMQRELLNEYEQFDASKSKPSSTKILEEEYEDESDHQPLGAEEGTSDSTPNEGETDTWTFNTRQSTELFWGYSVALQRYQENLNRDPKLLIQRPKLMMLGTGYTVGDRIGLRRKLTELIKRGIIRKYGKRNKPDVRDIRDVITDFLVKIFEHTKNELAREEGYTENCAVEFVVTVPTIWSQKSSRILQKCVEAAIQVTKFGALANGSVDNLFIIPEPEAGLTWLLQTTSAVFGQTVINLDAGGGTVDCVTYEISNNLPLKLEREVVKPGGDNCGSSYLNERFKEHLLDRLRDETYLDHNGITRRSIVETLTALNFEQYGKKKIDIYDAPGGRYVIAGLKGDKARGLVGPAAKRFTENIVFINEDDCVDIFGPILQRVWTVLQDQLDAAFDKGKMVKSVFLLGGFAGSPSLVKHLRIGLREYAEQLKLPYQIRLVEDIKRSNVAISSGAVLRALDKENGPKRFAQSSYGLLRREPYQPLCFKEHLNATAKIDDVDGERYLDVIKWVMVKGILIDPVHEFPPVKSIHTFELDKGNYLLELKCEELLYVSDISTKDHYTVRSQRNRDAQLIGSIVTNVTILRDKGHMEIITPETTHDGVLQAQTHYRVEYDLVIIVEGRNLKCHARWPCVDNQEEVRKRKLAGESEFIVLETVQVSIASAFQPGTK